VFERSGEYHKAIDRYIAITEGMFAPEILEEIWNNCFNIAMDYAKDRVQDVALTLGPRLIKINKFDSAAEFYEAVGLPEKAIECYVLCQKWDRAMDCAHQVQPREMQQMLMNKIQE
jgi:hypothetical protein